MHDCAEDDIRNTDADDPSPANTMSGPIRKVYTCQWIKTEPVEENETSNTFHQFQSEPVDKCERKGVMKCDSLTGVGLSCGQMSSGTTGSFEQSQCNSSAVKIEPMSDSESNSSRDTEPIFFSNINIKSENENDSKTDPNEARTSFSVNLCEPDTNGYLQTKETTDLKMTTTSIDEDEDKSPSIEQEYNDPCTTVHQDPGSNKPTTSVKTTARPFVCDVCEKTFTHKCRLREHKLIHTGQKPFTCDVCNQCFTKKKNLKTHMVIHTGQKPFVCDMCEKSFRRKAHLEDHKLTHTDIKLLVCEVCNKGFNHVGNLNRHKLTHSGEKPFVCDVCFKGFHQKIHLTDHKLTHTDIRQYVCDLCNKGFKQSGHLTQHILTHTDHKPYTCDSCNKSFAHSSNLARHKLVHTDNRPFVCDACDKGFKSRSKLKAHYVIHTRQQPVHDVSVSN